VTPGYRISFFEFFLSIGIFNVLLFHLARMSQLNCAGFAVRELVKQSLKPIWQPQEMLNLVLALQKKTSKSMHGFINSLKLLLCCLYWRVIFYHVLWIFYSLNIATELSDQGPARVMSGLPKMLGKDVEQQLKPV